MKDPEEPPLSIKVSCCSTCKHAVAGLLCKTVGMTMGAYGPNEQIVYEPVTKCMCSWEAVKIYYACSLYKENP